MKTKYFYFFLLISTIIFINCTHKNDGSIAPQKKIINPNTQDTLTFKNISLLSHPYIALKAVQDLGVEKGYLYDDIDVDQNTIFYCPLEKPFVRFDNSIVDKDNKKHKIDVTLYTYDDAVSMITLSSEYDLYKKFKNMYVEKYGEPDSIYSVEYNKGCIWNCAYNQQLRINLYFCDCPRQSRWLDGHEFILSYEKHERRTEIIYRNMQVIDDYNSILYKKKEQKKKEKEEMKRIKDEQQKKMMEKNKEEFQHQDI